jgi:hypothetical protein
MLSQLRGAFLSNKHDRPHGSAPSLIQFNTSAQDKAYDFREIPNKAKNTKISI